MAENDSKSSVELSTKLVQLGRTRDKTETIWGFGGQVVSALAFHL